MELHPTDDIYVLLCGAVGQNYSKYKFNRLCQTLVQVIAEKREIKAVAGGRLSIKDNVEEIYEKKVTPYGNGTSFIFVPQPLINLLLSTSTL